MTRAAPAAAATAPPPAPGCTNECEQALGECGGLEQVQEMVPPSLFFSFIFHLASTSSKQPSRGIPPLVLFI